jgi:integrase
MTVADKKKTPKTSKLPPGIKQLPDGRYRLLVKITDPRTKKASYVERTLNHGVTLGEAVDERAALVVGLKAGQAPSKKSEPPTLSAYAKLWIASKAARVRKVTAQKCAQTLTLYVLPRLGNLPIAEIRRSDLEQFAGWLETGSKLAIHTQRDAWKKAMSLLRDAWEEYELRPIGRLKGPQGDPPPAGRALSRDELDRLVQAALGCSARYGAVVVLMAYTGLRLTETVRLLRADLSTTNPDDAWLKVSHSKTKKGLGRRVPLPRIAVEALANHLAQASESPWLFPSLDDPRLPANISLIAGAVAKAAKLSGVQDVAPYDLRRTYITILEQVGVSRSVMRELVGHTSDTTTDIYVRPTDRDRRNALVLLEGGKVASKSA